MIRSELSRKEILEAVKKAYAKAAKEDDIKNKVAYREIVFNWNIQDLELWFNVNIKGGKIIVKEGEAKDPDMVFYNKTAEDFHKGNSGQLSGRDMLDNGGFRWTGNAKHMRYISMLCKSMRNHYKEFSGNI